MKFEIRAGELASAVAYAAAAISSKPVKEVLAGMKITAAEDGQVTFTGSDGDTIAAAQVAANVMEPGTAVIPGGLFATVTKGLPAGDLAHLVTKDTEAILGYGRGEYALVTLDAGLYPGLPEPAAPAGKAAADLLATAISRTAPVVSRDDDSLVEITAVQMILDEDEITFSATDRYRFMQARLPWRPDAPVRDQRPALVPARHLDALAKAVPSEHDVSVGVADGIVTFAAPGRSLTCRLITGEGFPSAGKQLAPFASPSTTAVVSRRDLAEAVTRVAAIADKNNPVHLDFTPGQVRVSADGGRGRGGEVLYADLDGPDQTWPGFRPGYLREALEAAGTQTVAFAFTTPRRPVLITDGEQDEARRDGSFSIVQMPQMPEAIAAMGAQS